MPSTHHLLDGARRATRDDDVAVAGIFLPRGFVGRSVLGSFLGSAAGAMADSAGQTMGATLGAATGMATVSDGGIRFIVAVSPHRVYVLHPEGFGGTRKGQLELLHTFDRSCLHVEVKARATVRILVLEDAEEGSRIELEGSLAHFKHANDVIHALVIDGHGDVPPDADDTVEANAAG